MKKSLILEKEGVRPDQNFGVRGWNQPKEWLEGKGNEMQSHGKRKSGDSLGGGFKNMERAMGWPAQVTPR